jgi:hypothetical protein
MLSLSFISVLLALLAPLQSTAAPFPLSATLNSVASAQYIENAITARFMNQQFANTTKTDSCTGEYSFLGLHNST